MSSQGNRMKQKTSKIASIVIASTFLSPAFATTLETSNPATYLQIPWLQKNINPADDFYTYANGSWQKKNPIPAEYSAWSNFSEIAEKTRKVILSLIQEAAAKNAKKGSIEQKVGDFYYSGMDEASIDRQGASPLQDIFARIDAVSNTKDLQAILPHLRLIGVDALFSFGSMTDFKDSNLVIGAAEQGGLGLPDRDYYLKQDEKFKKIRAIYLQHVAKMFELLGDAPARAKEEAEIVMRIETSLAQASMSQVEQRNPEAIYHIQDMRQLEELTPELSWQNYLTALGLPKVQRINVMSLGFFKRVNELLQKVPLEDWKVYLRWHVIDSFASFLSKPFVNQNFIMYQALTGTEKLLPRWKRVVSSEGSALGFAVGKLYVEKYFSPKDKADVLKMLAMIKKTLRGDLETLSWMSPKTREAAIKKLDLMQERVGYPEKWRDYSTLMIDRGPYVLNVIRANTFLVKRDLNKIDKPVDRTEWQMTPQTINAYYDPSMNNINLPAAILQAPFFDAKAPAAINYGGIGFVAAHEITHGFDDSGAQFDGKGNLKNWWTADDLIKFKQATDCIASQFSQYRVAGNVPIQGKLVVGEAVADLGGLILAYKAFHASEAFKTAQTIEGFSPDQQFFLSAAHVWAGNIRPEQEQNLATTDPHPPMKYRVNGSFANMPQFQEAFGIKGPSAMVVVKRCVIW